MSTQYICSLHQVLPQAENKDIKTHKNSIKKKKKKRNQKHYNGIHVTHIVLPINNIPSLSMDLSITEQVIQLIPGSLLILHYNCFVHLNTRICAIFYFVPNIYIMENTILI